MSLRALITPYSLERFSSELWQVRVGLLRADSPRRFNALLTRSRFEDMLLFSSARPERGDVLLLGVENGLRDHFPREILARGPLGDPARLQRYHRAYARGAALWIARAEQRDARLYDLCREVAEEARFPSRVDASLWPSGASASAPDAGDADRFLVMLEGSAKLHISSPGTAIHVLAGGDVLYAPIGSAVHVEAIAPTLLLDVRVEAYSYLDLLLRAVDRHAEREPALRRALSVGYERPSDRQLALWAEMVSALPRALDFERARKGQAGAFQQQSLPLGRGWTRMIDALHRLGLEAEVQLEAKLRVLELGGAVYVQGPAHTERFPRTSKTAVHRLCGKRRVRVEELDDQLATEVKLDLVRRFVEAGWSTVATDGATADEGGVQ